MIDESKEEIQKIFKKKKFAWPREAQESNVEKVSQMEKLDEAL